MHWSSVQNPKNALIICSKFKKCVDHLFKIQKIRGPTVWNASQNASATKKSEKACADFFKCGEKRVRIFSNAAKNACGLFQMRRKKRARTFSNAAKKTRADFFKCGEKRVRALLIFELTFRSSCVYCTVGARSSSKILQHIFRSDRKLARHATYQPSIMQVSNWAKLISIYCSNSGSLTSNNWKNYFDYLELLFEIISGI